jgi:DNA end-binding protein Ku
MPPAGRPYGIPCTPRFRRSRHGSSPELQLALQLIDQIAQDGYDPAQFVDEEKQRILAAIDRKIASGQQIVSAPHDEAPSTAQVIDLMEALRASLGKKPAAAAARPAAAVAEPAVAAAPAEAKERKGAKRASAAKGAEPAAAPAPARARK